MIEREDYLPFTIFANQVILAGTIVRMVAKPQVPFRGVSFVKGLKTDDPRDFPERSFIVQSFRVGVQEQFMDYPVPLRVLFDTVTFRLDRAMPGMDVTIVVKAIANVPSATTDRSFYLLGHADPMTFR